MVFLPRIEDRRILLPRPEELAMPFWVTSERGAGVLHSTRGFRAFSRS